MFLAKFNDEGQEKFYIYCDCFEGWQEFHKDTFSPLISDLEILKFSISGKTYKEKKENARDLAIDYQLNFSGLSWSYGELVEINDYFEKIGKRYGLLQEFKENGIC